MTSSGCCACAPTARMITRAAKDSIARNFRVEKITPVAESEIIALVNYCVRVAGVARVCLRRGKVCNRRAVFGARILRANHGLEAVPLHACAARQSEYNRRTLDTGESPTMNVANYCPECGAHLKRRGWRAWLNGNVCEDCARRLGKTGFARPLAVIAIIAITAFTLGRYLRPGAPPLVIERATNSPLSDLPLNLNDTVKSASRNTNSESEIPQASDNRSTRETGNTGSA